MRCRAIHVELCGASIRGGDIRCLCFIDALFFGLDCKVSNVNVPVMWSLVADGVFAIFR